MDSQTVAELLSKVDISESLKRACATPGIAYTIPLGVEYTATIVIAKSKPAEAAAPSKPTEPMGVVIHEACRKGNLDRLRELHAQGALTSEEMQCYHALEISCRSNQLAVAQWLVETFAKFPSQQLYYALEAIATHGHMDMLRWFCKTFASCLSQKDFLGTEREDGCHALHNACGGGHINAAILLVDHYKLTASHVRAENNGALRLACEQGHLTVASWLQHTFDLSTSEVESAVNWVRMFSRTSLGSHIELWLQKLKDADTAKALRDACAAGQLETVRRLRGEGRLTPEIVRTASALSVACINGHLLIAQWLRETFKLDAEEARRELVETITGAATNGHAETIRWIVDMAKLDSK